MTHNQLQYWANLEAARSNRAREGLTYMQNLETNRSNLVNEGIKRDTLSETTRHNVATEDLGNRQLSETKRHNVATESNTAFANQEQRRHNLVTESQTDFSNTEIRRHNKAAEAYSFATLPIQKQHADAATSQAAAAHRNATSNEMNAYTRQYEADTARGTLINRIVQDYGDDLSGIPLIGRYANAIAGTGGVLIQAGSLQGSAGDYYNQNKNGIVSNVPVVPIASGTHNPRYNTHDGKKKHRKR